MWEVPYAIPVSLLEMGQLNWLPVHWDVTSIADSRLFYVCFLNVNSFPALAYITFLLSVPVGKYYNIAHLTSRTVTGSMFDILRMRFYFFAWPDSCCSSSGTWHNLYAADIACHMVRSQGRNNSKMILNSHCRNIAAKCTKGKKRMVGKIVCHRFVFE